ncbi:putative dual specificity phosphatase, catalytic domain [Lyophyllum shimeji]|uniref:protein-tyrosine-phosphatase n=1 Tax=Lyophyllum shimeji TaxID=47721 RepID=A0A9P3Q245_LYOSH|nr:putative dual specificity phosphatase, catalytic domain [Lyophyllum shimeji]
MIRFDNMPPEVMQAMCTPMHQVLSPQGSITGSLYVGSLSALQDKDLLSEHGISHLVQVLDAPWLPLSEKDGFHCYRIQILDQSTVDLKPHLEAACNYIDRALRSGKNVLVHCQQGISRSPAIVIAYLIRNHGMSYDNAAALVKRKRACVKPNSGFVAALKESAKFFRAKIRALLTRCCLHRAQTAYSATERPRGPGLPPEGQLSASHR